MLKIKSSGKFNSKFIFPLKTPFGAGSLNVLFYRKLGFSEGATFS
jgi:hypothetical protein